MFSGAGTLDNVPTLTVAESEIDSLLAALSSGELDADEIKENANDKVVKNYDFNRPSKFSKDVNSIIKILLL